MAWLYVPGSEAWSSDSDLQSPDTALWLTLSGTPSQRPASWRGWKTRPWMRLLSGTTSRPSMAALGVASWIASRRASRASRSRSPALSAARTTIAGSSPKSFASFAKWDPASSSWKTSQACLFQGLDTFSGPWLMRGSMRNGVFSAPQESEPHIFDDESSSWPTPRNCTAMAATINPDAKFPNLETVVARWSTPMASDALGEMHQSKKAKAQGWAPRLQDQARSWPTPRAEGDASPGPLEPRPDQLRGAVLLWPTPTAQDDQKSPEAHLRMKLRMGERDGTGSRRTAITSPTVAVKAWPTPRVGGHGQSGNHQGTMDALEPAAIFWATPQAHDATGARSRKNEAADHHYGPHDLVAQATGRGRLVLNPRFVEWLMGLPVGWTAFEHLGMESSRWSRLMRSELSRLG